MTSQEKVDRDAQEALRLLGADPENWVLPTPGIDHDVAIVGGGQSGVAIGFALRRAGVANFTIIDAADDNNAGGWLTRARMLTLRTPKTRPGPELGIPALGFQAWYEGLHGADAFAAIGRIARTDWADYLKWFHRQVGVPVRYRTRLTDIEPLARGGLRLHLEADGRQVTETVRKVVLATGVEGTGGPNIPDIFKELPAELYAHTGQAIDFGALRGKTVGVLGAATSALDAAATALDAGAAAVHLFSYRRELVIAGTNVQHPAAQDNFHLQSDEFRWRAKYKSVASGSSSPLDSVLRATAFPGFKLHLNAPWRGLRAQDGKAIVEADDGTFEFDFIIAGTGYQYHPATRPELRRIAGDVALWRDRYQPPPEEASESIGLVPYLGAGYQFLEREPGTAPWLHDIHIFNAAASQSFGRPVGDIPSLRTGVPRLVAAIGHDLFFADQGRPKAPARSAVGPAGSHFDKYAHAVWRETSSTIDVPVGQPLHAR